MTRDEASSRDTRGRILAAAQSEFAEHGRVGASMRAIAARAGCAQSLIHHYFPTKDELWLAVGDMIAEEFFALEAPFVNDPAPDRESVRRGIELYWRFWRDHQPATRLYLWRLLEGMTPESLAKNLRYNETSVAAFRRAQEQGALRDDVPVEVTMNVIAGAIIHFVFHAEHLVGDGSELERSLLDSLTKFATRS